MTLIAAGIRLQVLAGLGLGPWDVLHMGLSLRLPITFGQANQLVGLVLVLGAWALGEPPRLGTLLNMWYVGAAYDLIEAWQLVPMPRGPLAAWVALLAGVALLAVGSAWYLSAGLGAGPRDGMTLALARRFARARIGRRPPPGALVRSEPGVGVARVLLEGSATLAGWALGGPVGVGSIVVAALVGPGLAVAIPWFRFARRWWDAATSPSPPEGRPTDNPVGQAHPAGAPAGARRR